MKAMWRSPWPAFGIGLGFAALGTAAALVRPDLGRSWVGYALCVPVFGGLLLVALSPAFEFAETDDEARRFFRAGLRWIGAWLLLFWAIGAVHDPLWPLLDPLLGPPGHPLRMVAALVWFVLHLAIPVRLATPLAEGVRRAAAWLGEA